MTWSSKSSFRSCGATMRRYEASVPSIMKSAAYTSTVVHHVQRMLDFYKRCCDVSQKPEDARRYRVIHYLYLAEPEEKKTFQQIADAETVDISTIYKDHKLALRQLSALFLGILSKYAKRRH